MRESPKLHVHILEDKDKGVSVIAFTKSPYVDWENFDMSEALRVRVILSNT